jgi:CPA2 family monovalent cation:H+ antiporter-2
MSETAPIILDLGLVLLLAALFGWIARRVGLPAVVGYLLAGLAVSPFTPGYVADSDQIALLADIGVVILLFEVGIEVDVRHLGRKLRPLFWTAPLQVVVSTAASALVFSLIGLPVAGALLVGLGISLSSSVVIVNITRAEGARLIQILSVRYSAGVCCKTSLGLQRLPSSSPWLVGAVRIRQ